MSTNKVKAKPRKKNAVNGSEISDGHIAVSLVVPQPSQDKQRKETNDVQDQSAALETSKSELVKKLSSSNSVKKRATSPNRYKRRSKSGQESSKHRSSECENVIFVKFLVKNYPPVLSLPVILQGIGLFTSKWVSTDACHSTGILYSCCYGKEKSTCAKTEGDGLDARALGLHCTAFALMLMATLCLFWSVYCTKDRGDYCAKSMLISFLVLPVAGLLSFTGCMVIASKYSASELGYSFILCLTSACLLFIATITTIFLFIVIIRLWQNAGSCD